MSGMSAELKLRTLAMQSGNEVYDLFVRSNGTFAWFDRQLQPGYLQGGLCVRVLRVSTIRQYCQTGISNLSQPRLQIDVVGYDAEACRTAAAKIVTFLGTISLASADQFNSPATTPPNNPNFLLSQRAGMDYQLQPPAYVEMLDVRLYNLEQ